MLISAVAIALIAASLPLPGPLTNTSTLLIPFSFATFAASSTHCCAANGVLFLLPLKPNLPALAHDTALP